ncbi:helix-turn-helix domain-containing protein [Enterococcus sp. BWM-S5]|uniref:Helix-turn-helix domain-containing protein n=1 Tax=Enterococcus larvae TaxID=2794352 RepID=A0ABS4CHY6_9ENTE|nr:Rgg/GadR/MutR family transcriptional regulator [Enterococcus larvae]MBP1045459.1 helix-turn-helix domain-containing protein [Enterococcus larvae]
MKNLKIRIGDTLRFFRNLKGFTQKEVLKTSADHSIYSRIENGKRSVRLEELQEILNTLSVNIEEFITFSDFDINQGVFRKDFHSAAVELDNPEKKVIMIQYYKEILLEQKKTAVQLSNFVSIKAYFSQFWSEIPPVSSEEVREAYELLSNTEYLLQYDYALLANMVYQFSTDQRRTLMKKAYPIADKQSRDAETLKHAYNVIPNAITACIQAKEYGEAKEYAQMIDTIDKAAKNLHIIMNIKYLENLIYFITTGDRAYQKKINRYIDILQEHGFTAIAEASDKEMKKFVFGDIENGEVPISTM